MKDLLLNFLLLLVAAIGVSAQTSAAPPQSNAAAPAESQSTQSAAKNSSIPVDQVNAQKARDLLNQSIQALGGQAYLTAHDKQEQGRTYSFYHGRPTSNGIFYWRFLEYPDKERVELTPQRDIAEIYVGDKGTEVTYKGPRAIEKKDMDDYVRRHRFSLDVILHNWVNDPSVALFFDGAALAGNLAAEKVTLINAKDEAVSLYFDVDTHLPIMKSYSWRDPVDHEKNTEEEDYNGYRVIQGINTAFGFTRYFNGDMQTERFINSASYNQGLNPAMFDPNSGYNPLKPEKKKK
jgi:hypothetical protein